MSKLIVGLLAILFIYLYLRTAIKIYTQGKRGEKVHPLWLLLIILFPVIGPVLYLSK